MTVTSEQQTLAKNLIFRDHELSFTVSTSSPAEDSASREDGDDFDVPIVHEEDLEAIRVDGLKFVGGLDISFVEEEDNQTHDTNLASLNIGDDIPTVDSGSSGATAPDAYATVVVLGYPSLKVSRIPRSSVQLIIDLAASVARTSDYPAHPPERTVHPILPSVP